MLVSSLFLLGIIKAIQLDYSEAHKNLLQAIRKAPQQAAYGFKQTVSAAVINKHDLIHDVKKGLLNLFSTSGSYKISF